jgi:hypothetical protein
MTARRHGTGSFIPTSVEGFRYAYGRAPTPAELRACIDAAHPPRQPEPYSNGCDCYDPECSICCDDEGNPRPPA